MSMFERIKKGWLGYSFAILTWFFFFLHLFWDYQIHGPETMAHFLGAEDLPHHVPLLLLPFLATAIGYLLDKRAAERKESEERLRTLLDSVQAGVMLIDAETHEIAYANPAALKMFSAPGKQVVGSVCHKYICPAEEGKCPITDLGQEVDNSERVLLTAKSEQVPVIKTVVPTVMKGRKYLLESFIDITERRHAEEALRESEEKYRALVEDTNDIPYSLDSKGTVTYMGPQVSRYGFSPEEIVSKNFLQFIFPEDREELLSGLKKTIETGEELGARFRIEDKEGNLRWLDEYGKVQRDESGRIVGIRGILRDITERKRMEEELKESNRMKDTFTDIMRHDLIGPAGNIQNLLEVARGEEDEIGRREILEHLYRNAKHLVELIEHATKIAKLEGEKKLDTAQMDLGQILKEVVRDLRSKAGKNGVEIENRATGTYPVKANPLVEDVFSNLIENAIKYGPEKGKVIVDIEDAGKNWKVSVTDFGEGIEDKYKEGVFERFSRRHKEGVKGSGLGLSIVKRVVDLHDGRVWVEDNPEGGSIFYVEMPKKGINGLEGKQKAARK